MRNHLIGWRKPISRQAVGRFHDQRVGLFPFRRFGGFSAAQFEIAGVKQGIRLSLDKNLGRTKNVTGRKQRNRDIVHGVLFAERQHVLVSLTGHSRLHQAGGPLRHDDFGMRRDVIAMSMRDEREPFRLPGIEPQILRR